MFIDLDNFKPINDRHGRARACCRRSRELPVSDALGRLAATSSGSSWNVEPSLAAAKARGLEQLIEVAAARQIGAALVGRRERRPRRD